MANILIIIFYLIAPAGVLWLCDKVKLLNKIGAILLLYLLGIILVNLDVLPEGFYPTQDLIVSLVVPLAIPLLLFSCDFKQWSIKKALLTLISGVVAVVVVIVVGFFVFRPFLQDNPLVGDQLYKLSGLMAGVYTGGTPNLAALKMMLNIPSETYIMVHSYDMIISILYLAFILSFGIRLFRWLLPNGKSEVASHESSKIDVGETPYSALLKKEHLASSLGVVGLSLLILAASFGVSLLFSASVQMMVVILLLTTLGIAASFVPKIRRVKTSYNIGMYLVLIFSVVVASMADFSKLNFQGGVYIFAYLAFVVFGSLLIQTVLAKFLKIDADTMIISSVSLINSPPFVPLIATAMGNRNVIVTGLTVGLVGYAVGNYLGFIIAELLFFVS